MTLLQTALEQNWTIGQLNQRIKEQSLLNSLDNRMKRSELNGSAGRGNRLNNPLSSSPHSRLLIIDADPCSFTEKRKVFKSGEVK